MKDTKEDMVWCAEYDGYLLDYVTIEPYGGEPCRYLMEDEADEYSGVWLYIGDRLVSNNCFAAGALLDDCIDVIRGDAKVVRACDRFNEDIEYIAEEYADEI